MTCWPWTSSTSPQRDADDASSGAAPPSAPASSTTRQGRSGLGVRSPTSRRGRGNLVGALVTDSGDESCASASGKVVRSAVVEVSRTPSDHAPGRDFRQPDAGDLSSRWPATPNGTWGRRSMPARLTPVPALRTPPSRPRLTRPRKVTLATLLHGLSGGHGSVGKQRSEVRSMSQPVSMSPDGWVVRRCASLWVARMPRRRASSGKGKKSRRPSPGRAAPRLA